jgi:hypothetical protein
MAGTSTMKRATILATAYAYLVLLGSHACRGAGPQPGSPETVVSKAMNAVNHGQIDDFTRAMHPESLEDFRTAVLGAIDDGVKKVGEAKVLEAFPGPKTLKALKELPAPKLFAAFVRRRATDPSMKKTLASTKVEVYGHVAEGDDTTHVIYRTAVKLGESDVVRLNTVTLHKSGDNWKLAIPEEFAGPMKQTGQRAPGTLPNIDIKAMQVEPLGHVLANGKEVLILYRTSMPVGDSFTSKLAVMDLAPFDPGAEAAKADNLPEVKKFLESRLGLRQTPAPAAASTARRKSSTSRSGAMARATPREPRTPTKSAPRKTQPSNAKTDSAASGLPDGLVDLPTTFRGGDRDRFHDIAPEGGVLVGARVSYIERFGGHKISSIQPIYRVGEELVDGKRWGGLLGEETTAVAKPGYAVGAIDSHTGITVDGFEMVFMKIDGDRLDSRDSYKSPWLGDEKGGSPRDVSSEGKIPLGLQGRAGKEVYALGLIVEK